MPAEIPVTLHGFVTLENIGPQHSTCDRAVFTAPKSLFPTEYRFKVFPETDPSVVVGIWKGQYAPKSTGIGKSKAGKNYCDHKLAPGDKVVVTVQAAKLAYARLAVEPTPVHLFGAPPVVADIAPATPKPGFWSRLAKLITGREGN